MPEQFTAARIGPERPSLTFQDSARSDNSGPSWNLASGGFQVFEGIEQESDIVLIERATAG